MTNSSFSIKIATIKERGIIMNTDLLSHAQEYIEKMANGINPINNEKVKSDDSLNNIRISRCLFYVNSILKDVLKKELKTHKPKKSFYLTKEELNNYEYTEEAVPITKIVRQINELVTDQDREHLKVTQMMNWLISIDLLEVVTVGGKNKKIPTDIGKKLGIYLKHQVTLEREYDQLYYSKTSQMFIINNFEHLLKYIKENK